LGLFVFYFQELEANFELASTILNTLSPPIIARFIKIKPKTWTNAITLRVELYGCYDGMYNSIMPSIITFHPLHCGEGQNEIHHKINDLGIHYGLK